MDISKEETTHSGPGVGNGMASGVHVCVCVRCVSIHVYAPTFVCVFVCVCVSITQKGRSRYGLGDSTECLVDRQINLKQAGSVNIICGSWEDRFKGLLR